MNHNLQVNYDGSIFEYSGTEKEGFVKHTNTKDKVSYRKFYNQGVEGELVYIDKKNNQYKNNAEEVILGLKNGEDIYYLSFTVLNQDGTSIDDYTQGLITLLDKLNKGETYNINNWFMKKGDVINNEEVKYNKKGITIKQNGEKIKSDMTFEYIKGRGTDEETHVKGDVPMLQWKEIAGKNRPTAGSKEARLEFLYSILAEEVTRISGGNSTETENTIGQKEPKKEVTIDKKTVTKKDPIKKQPVMTDNDDLPF
jgi:hypothetical protein